MHGKFETQVPGTHVPDVRFQVPGLRCQQRRLQFTSQVVGAHVSRCQVPGIRFQVPRSQCQVAGVWSQRPGSQGPCVKFQGSKATLKYQKLFTLKIFYVLTELQNYFTCQRKLQTYKHIFHHDNIFFIQLTKLLTANCKIKR